MLWWILAACVFVVVPVLLRWLVGDDPTDNAIAQEQENPPRKSAEVSLAA